MASNTKTDIDASNNMPSKTKSSTKNLRNNTHATIQVLGCGELNDQTTIFDNG
jgi:hypothetical protein